MIVSLKSGIKMRRKNKNQKKTEAIVHGTIGGDFEKEKFKVEIEENGKITKWQPLN